MHIDRSIANLVHKHMGEQTTNHEGRCTDLISVGELSSIPFKVANQMVCLIRFTDLMNQYCNRTSQGKENRL